MKLIVTRFEVAAFLAGLALLAATPAQAKKPIELHFGNQPWHIVLSAGDLTPVKGAPSTADRQTFMYRNDRQMLLSVTVENAHESATMESCGVVFEHRKKFGAYGAAPSNERQGQRGEAAMQEYDVKLGAEALHNIFSCRVRGTYYIDVHASKLPYRPGDHDALLALVNSVVSVESHERNFPPPLRSS